MIQRIGVIGAGQMGNGIAHVCALAGFDVKLADVDKAQLDKAKSLIEQNMSRQVKRGDLFFALAGQFWDGLSADQKAAIEAAEAKAKAFNDAGVIKTEADASGFFESKGVTVTTPDGQTRAATLAGRRRHTLTQATGFGYTGSTWGASRSRATTPITAMTPDTSSSSIATSAATATAPASRPPPSASAPAATRRGARRPAPSPAGEGPRGGPRRGRAA